MNTASFSLCIRFLASLHALVHQHACMVGHHVSPALRKWDAPLDVMKSGPSPLIDIAAEKLEKMTSSRSAIQIKCV